MRFLPLLMAALLGPMAAHAQRGVPQSGFPSWQERMMLVLANRARADPGAEQYNACGGTTIRPPLIWNYNVNRVARFHCSNLARTGVSLRHDSPCTLVSNISDIYAPNGTCDGSASCACVSGVVACDPTCTAWSARLTMFGVSGGGRAENVASGQTSPRQVHNGWMNSSGHCSNILGNYVSFGAGWDSNRWAQNFWTLGTVSGTLIAGGHEPQLVGSSATSIEFRVNYYDTRGGPGGGVVNIDGDCTPMVRERGSATNGTYLATVSLTGTGCRRYVFVFEDPQGGVVLLPESGSYGVGGAGCADWAAEASPMCDVSVLPPTVHTAAAASPNPVTATTTSVSVLGSHQEGESSLVYTWSATGPGSVTFSPNGTNAAKNSVATFTRTGSHTLTATIRDAYNQTVISSVVVAVQATVSSLSVSPSSVSVAVSGTQQFSGAASDQFSQTISPVPAFSWSVSGGGTISASGLFTAGTTTGGPHTVTAGSGGVSGTATLNVTQGDPPTVAIAAAASPNPVPGTTTTVSVLGAHHLGESGLTYIWSATGPGSVSFGPNGTNAAKSSAATFSRAGGYTLEVSIVDGQGQTTGGSVEVEVLSTLEVIAVSPGQTSVEVLAGRLFSAEAVDQFGDRLGASPPFSWSVSGGGTIDQGGLFTAGDVAGGPHTVQASASDRQGEASVTVIDAGSDSTPPEVSLSRPAAGQIVSGLVALGAVATDDVGVALVEFLADGELVGSSLDEPWECEWDTGGLAEGEVELVARATDTSGNQATSHPVVVILVDASEDEHPPTVVIVSPEDGHVAVERTLWIVAEAEDDVGVAEVSFEIDGEIVAVRQAPPWAIGIDMAGRSAGELVIVAIAQDVAGKVARSEPVRVERVDSISLVGECGCATGGGAVDGAMLLVLLLWPALRRRRSVGLGC